MRKTNTHLFFWDTIYSQWFTRPDRPLFKEGQLEFWTAEHYMMYHKAKLFGDEDVMAECLKAHHPNHVKGLGRDIQTFDQTTWNTHKLDIVVRGNCLKFRQNEDLKEQMFADKDLKLVEASPYDKIWGIGLHYTDDKVLNEANWQGENLLGQALMLVRTSLLNEESASNE